MSVQIRCPKCHKTGNAPDHLVGQTVRCKQCGHGFTAEAPQPATPTAPTQAPPRRGKASPAELAMKRRAVVGFVAGGLLMVASIPVMIPKVGLPPPLPLVGQGLFCLGGAVLAISATIYAVMTQMSGAVRAGADLQRAALASWAGEQPRQVVPGVTGFKGEHELKRQAAVSIHPLGKDIIGGWKVVTDNRYPLRGTLVLTTHRLMVLPSAAGRTPGAVGMWRLSELGDLAVEGKLTPPLLHFSRPGGAELVPKHAGVDVSDAPGWLRAIQAAQAALPPSTET